MTAGVRRKRTGCAIVLLGMTVGLACAESDDTTSQPPASDLYLNGRIYTLNADQPWATAMAVADGVILAVGEDDALRRLADADTTLHDLGGRMVMPGIHDTHLHPLQAGVQERLECRFRSGELPEVLAILRTCIAQTPSGQWVRGGQWNEGLFPPGRHPKAILDEIAGDHPVFLMDWSVHNAWVNSAALKRFGIGRDTPDPRGGVIVRDAESGEATGLLLDNAAYERWRILPAYNLAERANALAWSVSQIAGHGVTTFREAISDRVSLETFAERERRGTLVLRVKTSLSWKSAWAPSHESERDTLARRDDFSSAKVDASFAKIMLDGIPPTYTAALLEPYAPSETHGADHRGTLMLAPDELVADVTELDRMGLTIKMHATGDRSARVVLDAVEAARKANGDSGLIHEVSHAAMIHPDDIPRFEQLNVAAEMCPILWYPIPGLDWESWLGPERAKLWPVKSLTESGALVTYGSDWPVVETPNPWPGIEAMVTRRDPTGTGEASMWPEQAVDLATALRIFTRNGAVANKVGERSGSLEAGKDADFIVLDRHLFDIPIGDVGETQVLVSVVGGQVVFDHR